MESVMELALPRRPRHLVYDNAFTALIDGDRLIFNMSRGRLSFSRGVRWLYLTNGITKEKVVEFTQLPNRIMIEQIARFCGALMTLETHELQARDAEHLVFEFRGAGEPFVLIAGDRMEADLARGTVTFTRYDKPLRFEFTSLATCLIAAEIATLASALMGLGVTRLHRKIDLVTFEFT